MRKRILGAFSLLFCSRKFTLNKSLTTWPKFLLFNPGACHTHIKWFFTASWWQKLSAGVASDRFGVVLINGFPISFRIFIAPDHSHFAFSTFRGCKITRESASRVLIDKSISKSDSNSTRADQRLAVNLSTIGHWHKVNICRDSRIMPTPHSVGQRAGGATYDDSERKIEGKKSDFDKDMTFHSLVGPNHWWLMDLITSA